jgi:hypothetical protein
MNRAHAEPENRRERVVRLRLMRDDVLYLNLERAADKTARSDDELSSPLPFSAFRFVNKV